MKSQGHQMELFNRVVRDRDADQLVGHIRSTGQGPLWERGVVGARAYLEERAAAAPPSPSVDIVEDEVIAVGEHPFPVRVYRSSSGEERPVVVYFHGGGWVIGSLQTSDGFCRRLVHAADCVVVAVGYRKAPEHPFPAAIDDATAAIAWASATAERWSSDPARLVVLGDSAGGNIATVAVRRLMGTNPDVAVARQILAYPGTSADRNPSSSDHGSEWPLTDADRLWFLDQYVSDEAMRSDPDVAPLLADVAGMPPTTVLLGGCDPLLEEGLAYSDHLCRAGVSVDVHLYAGQIHGFLTLDPSILPRSREALGVVANAIGSA